MIKKTVIFEQIQKHGSGCYCPRPSSAEIKHRRCCGDNKRRQLCGGDFTPAVRRNYL